jgi:hypoxanthine phosphoribosyltransferase
MLIPASRIRDRLRALARRIELDLPHRQVVLIGVLQGAFIFMADLARHLRMPVRCGFVHASSYGDRRRSGGVVRTRLDSTLPLAGAHVILLEDIVDTGLTVHRLMGRLRALRPASLRLCVLLWKQGPKRHPVRPDYVGFRVPNRFVVGYGLDFAGQYRNLPYVGVLP